MNKKEKREFYRLLLVEPIECQVMVNGLFAKDLKITDISMTGAFIEDDNLELDLNKEHEIYIEMPDNCGWLVLTGIPVRCNWAEDKRKKKIKGYGIKFKNSKLNRIFEAYLQYKKETQIISVAKRLLKEYHNK